MALDLKTLAQRIKSFQREHYPVLGQQFGAKYVLVHYTTLGAVWDMVSREGGGIRAFGSVGLDDPTEGRVTERDRGVKDVLSRSDPEGWCNRRYREAAVCCFVAGPRGGGMEDNVLLWQLYGRRGAGVSIQIEGGVGAEWLDQQNVEQVHYAQRAAQHGPIDVETLRELIVEINRAASTQKEDGNWQEVKMASDDLFKQRFLVKASEYSHEREVRAVRWKEQDDDQSGREVFLADGSRIRPGWQYPEFEAKEWLKSGTRITFGTKIEDWKIVVKSMKHEIEERHGKAVADGITLERSGQEFGR